MHIKLFSLKSLSSFAVILAVGMAACVLAFATNDPASPKNTSATPSPEAGIASPTPTPHVYPKNKSGQTYGSSSEADSLETEPDLIAAYDISKKITGYVRKTDLNEPMPKTPEQAIQWQTERAGTVRIIPLYDVEGKKVIGKFQIGGEGESFYEMLSNGVQISFPGIKNSVTSIKNGNVLLIPHIDYYYDTSTRMILLRKSYINTYLKKTSAPLILTVSFTGGTTPKSVFINEPIK